MAAAVSEGDREQPRRGVTRSRIDLTARLGATAAAAATLLAALARTGWIADLASHFPWQYAAVALLAGIALAWLRRPVWALASIALFAVNLYAAWPSAAPPTTPPRSQPLRILVSNVFFASSSYGRVIEFARTARPDVAVFVEVTPEWRKALEVLRADLPHALYAGSGRHGVLVLSRPPLLDGTTLSAGRHSDPMLHARLAAGSRRFDLFAVHANWPLGPHTTALRNRQLRLLAERAAGSGGPVVIAGDLNVSPYSPHFRDLLEQGGVRSAAHGRWMPTWPTFFPPAGIQLDHVLVSSEVGVKVFETGPRVGSDHLPIVADLVL